MTHIKGAVVDDFDGGAALAEHDNRADQRKRSGVLQPVEIADGHQEIPFGLAVCVNAGIRESMRINGARFRLSSVPYAILLRDKPDFAVAAWSR